LLRSGLYQGELADRTCLTPFFSCEGILEMVLRGWYNMENERGGYQGIEE
jgi:hypothetical protein